MGIPVGIVLFGEYFTVEMEEKVLPIEVWRWGQYFIPALQPENFIKMSLIIGADQPTTISFCHLSVNLTKSFEMPLIML
jgi:hypothetical protein